MLITAATPHGRYNISNPQFAPVHETITIRITGALWGKLIDELWIHLAKDR